MPKDKCITCDDKHSIMVIDKKGEHEIYGCPECVPFPEEVKKKIRARMKKYRWQATERRE